MQVCRSIWITPCFGRHMQWALVKLGFFQEECTRDVQVCRSIWSALGGVGGWKHSQILWALPPSHPVSINFGENCKICSHKSCSVAEDKVLSCAWQLTYLMFLTCSSQENTTQRQLKQSHCGRHFLFRDGSNGGSISTGPLLGKAHAMSKVQVCRNIWITPL